jgi:type II secretory ATPase GspE/PulE/Tfp pilus assembly ATPase PilB-like protein
MPEFLAASVGLGGYVSLFKLIIFVGLFFAWIPLINWVNEDTRNLEIKNSIWTIILFIAGIVGLIAWILVPVFIAGFLIFIIVIGVTAIIYVRYRNTLVMDHDKLLTIDHIKSLMVSKEKKLEAIKGFSFYTANKNEVPLPQPRTKEFPGYKATYDLIKDATWRRASSIILSPTPQDYQVAYHIDGTVAQQPALPKGQADYLINFVKNLADLDTNEKRKPQKGLFRLHKHKQTSLIEWEVSTAGSTAGEQVRLKQITQSDKTKLTDLGLMPEQIEQMQKLTQAKQGVVIVSGPEKSGVTTTLYAMVRCHDAFLANVTTLERQPSERLPNIIQNVYSLSDTGTTTFAKKLQTIVLNKPDVIAIAGCEDTATAKVACAAAREGRLVYLTLKANSVIEALNKWFKLVGDRNLAAGALIGISNQRLIRQLCKDCKEGYTPDKEQIRKFNLSPEKTKVLYRAGKVIYDKRGKGTACENCQGTGYLGRTGIFELITINKELSQVIQTQPIDEIGKHFRRARMLYLQEQALRKVINGTTTINEMIRVLKRKEDEDGDKQ